MIINTSYSNFKKLLGDGSKWGVNISFATQIKPNGIAESFVLAKEFIKEDNIALILGDNFYYGINFNNLFQQISVKNANILVEQLETKVQKGNASAFIDQAIRYKDIKIIKEFIESTNSESLKILIDEIRNKSASTVVLLSSINHDKAQLLVGVSDDLIDRGIHAGNLVKEGSKILGGGGGGKSTFAQGGGDDIKQAKEVLNILEEQIKKII